MKKNELVRTFIKHLQNEMQLIRAAALATHEAATNEESKPENQYDTRALEASYLADAQAKRVNELEELLHLFQTLNFKSFGPTDPVDITALVKISVDGKKSTVLIMPKGGGVSCNIDTENVQIVTPSSLLGEAILGLVLGAVTEFEVGARVRECEIVQVI